MIAADNLRRIDRDLFSSASATLVNAFSDDHILKKLGLKPKTVNRLYEMTLVLGFRSGEVYATSAGCEGIMVFTDGEKTKQAFWEFIRSGSFLSSFSLVAVFFNKAMRRMFTTLERDRKNLRIGPYLYLNVIGVAKEQQGKGYGGVMLKFLCDRADREAKAIYLETQSQANVRWYETFGFQVVKKATFCEWLAMWEMVRDAQRR